MILDAYGFTKNWVKKLRNKETLTFDEAYFIGGRFSGKSLAIINFAIYCLLMLPSFNAFFVRKMINQKREMFNSIIDELPDGFNYEINKNEMFIKYKKNELRVLGLPEENVRKKQQKHGLQPHSNEVCIIVYEEAFEFDEKDFYYVNVGVRGKKEKTRLIFYISNPISNELELIKKADSIMPFDIGKLKSKGYQYKIINRGLMFYNNYQFIEKDLSKTQIDNIKRNAQQTPHLKDMILYGVPGEREEGVYSQYLQFLKHGCDKNNIRAKRIRFGVDWGASIDPTAVICLVEDYDGVIHIINELIIDTRKSVSLDVDDERVVSFVRECLKPWLKEGDEKGVHIHCDNVLSRIQNCQTKINDSENYHFINTTKYRIINRINWTFNLMAKQRLCVHNAPNLLREWNLAEWDKKLVSVNWTRIDRNNHSIDAFEYAATDTFMEMNIV